MRIAFYRPHTLPHSVRVYTENVTRELAELGVQCVSFAPREPLPNNVDLYWDPCAAGGVPPYERLHGASKPVVVTVHGAAPMAVAAREYFPTWRHALRGKIENRRNLAAWRGWSARCAAIITVSAYAKAEIVRHLELPAERVVPIHHGVDLATFQPEGPRPGGAPYFLHVSQPQPLKNVDRMLAAHARLDAPQRPRLVLIASGLARRRTSGDVEVVQRVLSGSELAVHYRGALAFVFPSLRESFGLPILEAMACGCPVVTSNRTGCAEVAGEAALLVDPYSTEAIADAMRRLVAEPDLCAVLRARGLARAAAFTWRQSAQGHLRVFERAVTSRAA